MTSQGTKHEPSADAKPAGRFRLVVDDRECRGPMPAALAACKVFAVEVRRLPVGDYRLDDALLFERKTLPDLAASIKDGRLFAQALRLAKAGLPAALILEGNTRDLASSGMRVEAIRGALVTVSLFIGLPLLRTQNAEDTVRTLRCAAQQRCALASSALPRRGRRPKGKAALQSHVLQGLPGIGPQRAARLIQRFGSIEAAIAADVQALAKVEGIGPAIARKLRWTVEEPRGVYARTVGETDTGSKPASASARANADSAPYGIQLQTLCGPGHAGAKRWRALTPFVPPRYLKPNGRNALLGQINAELATRGFPEAVNCKVRDPHDHDDARRARHFRCVRGSGASAPQNLGLVVDLEFANPLPGPIILGYGCHIGLGVFRACE